MFEFDRKLFIHPKQIAAVAHAFFPSASELELAKRVSNAGYQI
jgi:citrate lyase beta subunit